MKRILIWPAAATLLACSTRTAEANLLTNGNLDLTHKVEVVPSFFLPQPNNWVNDGFRTISGPTVNELSSEPWAGPAPTPVTIDGLLNPPFPEGCDGGDCGVFFKAFEGSVADPVTGNLYQDVAATPGVKYTLTGWAGGEANFLGDAELALDFLDAGNVLLSSAELDLELAGLLTPNGEPFSYKQYQISETAPANAATVRARVSMIDGLSNPAGGGQAFVVDDFDLIAGEVPEPGTVAAGVFVVVAALAAGRRRAAKRG